MRSKSCIYCKKTIDKMNFPSQYHRMITCGSVECMGKRRRELWEKRYYSEGE